MDTSFTLISAIVMGLIFGLISRYILSNKGYDDSENHGFAWGFWLGVIGLIVCVAKQPKENHSYMAQPMYYSAPPSGLSYQTKNDDDWRCTCGAMNKNYESSCHRCGKLYRELRKEQAEVKKNEELKKDNSSLTGQLSELKALLDSGMISQEEFDAKRKKILDL